MKKRLYSFIYYRLLGWKTNVKGYYKKFRSDFNAKVDAIIEAIGKLK